MVTIPSYYVDSQRARPKGQVQETAQATGQQMGAGVGASLQEVGQGLANVASALDYRDALTARADSDAAYNAYMQERMQLLRDPDSGYLNQTGGNAVGGRDSLDERMRAARDKIEQGMSPRALREFKSRADGVDLEAQTQAINHESGQLRAYKNSSAQAAVNASLREAEMLYNDREASDKFLNDAIAQTRQNAALNGWPAEQTENEILRLKSATVQAQATNLAYEDPILADQFLDDNKDRMSLSDYNTTKSKLKPIVVDRKARMAVDDRMGFLGRAAVPGATEALSNAAKLVTLAGSTIGMNERDQRDAIMSYLADGGVNLDPATTAWCAAFVNGTLGQAGFKGTGSLAARSFANWGVEVTGEPAVGDIVVMSRGSDQSKGHVGFYAGKDENGRPLILGGNQGDSVSIAAMDENTIITVRRAPSQQDQPGTSGSVAGMLDELMAIEDPDVREASLTVFKQRMAMRDYVQGKEQEEMANDAWTEIVNGTDPNDLPYDVQTTLGAATMTSLISAAQRYQLGTDITDEERFHELYDMMANPDGSKRQEFLDYDLNGEMDNLSQSDLRYFKGQQTSLRDAVSKPGSNASDTVYSMEDFSKTYTAAKDRFIGMTGINPGSGASKDEMRRWNQFTQALQSRMRDYADANGAQMPLSEVDKTIGMLLIPVTIKPKGPFAGAQPANMFDIPFRASGSAVDVALTAGDITVRERSRVADTLTKAWQRQPTEDEVVEHYEREQLLAMGLRPEIEFKDIPADIRKTMKKKYPQRSDEQLIDLYLSVMVSRTTGGE